MKIGENDVIFNSVSNSFLKITPSISACLNDKDNDVATMDKLTKNGFIVSDDINERDVVNSLRLRRKFALQTYQLVVNTSLDCNLGCWYCYETHIPHSFMKLDIAERIIKHVEMKFESEHFEMLQMIFFGGEPLMNIKVISYLLNGIQNIAKEKDFKMSLTFVTNGTLITKRFINMVKPFNAMFQITVDGNRTTHNEIRKYKKENSKDCYNTILNNIRLLNDTEANFTFNLRVNYDQSVLENIDTLIDDFSFINRNKCSISLQKVWQCDEKDIDSYLLYSVVNKINNKGFIIDSYFLSPRHDSCYADNLNEALINYDGKVFKCTARNFVKEKQYGVLDENGFIEWNTDMVYNRMSIPLQQKCQECILLPSCGGICTQHKLDGEIGNMQICRFDSRLSVEDIIILSIKQRIICKTAFNNVIKEK